MNAAARTVLATCIALVGLSTMAPASAQAVYSWKDDKGVTHYSDAPPAKGAAKKRELHAPAPATAPVVAAKTEAKADGKLDEKAQAEANATAAKAQAEKLAAIRAANCKTAQSNLAMLQQTASPVGVDANGDGKIDSEYSAEQRAAQTQSMQAAVASNCAQ
ncbi:MULTISPECIES: DUF4124 domain-containing protein [Lysobacteraceae]|nr:MULTISPECIES: DUF4124 domain-containing protein [Lysobacter]